MKISALSSSPYPPQHSPMGHRLHCYMLALKEMGHEVTVYNLSKNLHSGEYEGIKFDTIKFKYQVSLYNSKEYIKSLKDCLKPILSDTQVFFHSEDRISTILALQDVANSLNVKTVIELNEYPYGFKTRRLDFYFLRLIKQKVFFRYVLPKVGGVIAISKNLEALTKKYNTNVIRVPILTKHFEIKRKLSDNYVPFILHAGALSENKDGIKAILKAYNIAQKQLEGNLHFIFTIKKGLPSLMNWIDVFIKKNELSEKVFFKGLVSQEDLNLLYEDCSLAIINKPYNLQNRNNFPTKLTELLPRRIPLIVSNTGELSEYFQHEVNCLIVPPNDVIKISESIVKIIKNKSIVALISKNGLELCKGNFHYKLYSEILNSIFK